MCPRENVLKRGNNWLSYYQNLSLQATKEVSLDGAIQAAEDITNGQITGRVVIKL